MMRFINTNIETLTPTHQRSGPVSLVQLWGMWWVDVDATEKLRENAHLMALWREGKRLRECEYQGEYRHRKALERRQKAEEEQKRLRAEAAEFTKAQKKVEREEAEMRREKRIVAMVAMHTCGYTLAEIGAKFSVCRCRADQLIRQGHAKARRHDKFLQTLIEALPKEA